MLHIVHIYQVLCSLASKPSIWEYITPPHVTQRGTHGHCIYLIHTRIYLRYTTCYINRLFTRWRLVYLRRNDVCINIPLSSRRSTMDPSKVFPYYLFQSFVFFPLSRLKESSRIIHKNVMA